MYPLAVSHIHVIYFDYIHPPFSPSNFPNCPTLFPSQIHVLRFVVNNNLLSTVSAFHMYMDVRLGHELYTTGHIPKEE